MTANPVASFEPHRRRLKALAYRMLGSVAEAKDLTAALMLAFERLSPLERAAFLLHDVFELDFPEIAATLDRSPAACRQLAARARQHVREARPRSTRSSVVTGSSAS